MAQMVKGKALHQLRQVLDKVPELKGLSTVSPEFQKWRRNAEVAIGHTFGSETSHVSEFKKIRYSPSVWTSGMPDSDFRSAYVRDLGSAAGMLESMIDEINEYWEEESKPSQSSESHKSEQIITKEIFVVHGRDEGAREKVARFLERLELKPVVLHEQPNEGRTIIEKFENYAHVGFAVILLTPDDEGRLKEDGGNLESRGRQNVVFELGYFIGKLGRGRVCALVKGDVEKPSDYDGVLYIPLDDSGGWELRLIQELKSAGYDIDANRAFAT